MQPGIKIFFILCACAVAVSFCEKDKPVIQEKVKPTRAGLEKELKNLETDFEILQKDDPPQYETTHFRFEKRQAEKSLEEGDLKTARESLGSAREWMEEAKVRYYASHRKRVMDPESDETGEELMEETREFWRLAEEHKRKGEMEVYEKYHRAAKEQGELAVLAYSSDVGSLLELAGAAREQEGYLRSAGDIEDAQRIQDLAVLSIQEKLDHYTRQVRKCLSGQVEECEPEKLKTYRASFEAAEDKVKGLAQERKELFRAANEVYPGKFNAEELSAEIALWESEYELYYESIRKRQMKEQLEEERRKREEAKKRDELISRMNSVCDGALALKDDVELLLEESTMDFEGEKVIIKGRVSNRMDHSIYELRVAVCHGLVSELNEVGGKEVRPGMTFPFKLELVDFSIRDIVENAYRLPSHKLVILYKDKQGGQHKVYRPY